jgi:hypothetical protein
MGLSDGFVKERSYLCNQFIINTVRGCIAWLSTGISPPERGLPAPAEGWTPML